VERATPGGQPRRSHGRLQPGKDTGGLPCHVPEEGWTGGLVVPVRQDLLAEAEAEVLGEGGELPRMERDRARRAAESLARRQMDQEKLNSLVLAGLAGPEYEIFAGELAAYGYPVVLAWLRRGMIWKHCADRGRPLRPTDADRETLANEFEERLELALETVAEALKFFRERVLLTGRWSYEGGATLTTFFTGACLLTFPNVFRRWQAARQRWSKALAAGTLNCPEGRTLADLPGADPAEVVAGRAAVLSELASMPAGTRDAAALVIDGMSFAEAGNSLRTTERAIEGRLYRYRQRRAS
jgi:hypothetical protein